MPQRKKEREGEIFLVLSSTYIHFGLARERVVEREGQRERESGSEREREREHEILRDRCNRSLCARRSSSKPLSWCLSHSCDSPGRADSCGLGN